jgi:hypothetical protein
MNWIKFYKDMTKEPECACNVKEELWDSVYRCVDCAKMWRQVANGTHDWEWEEVDVDNENARLC